MFCILLDDMPLRKSQAFRHTPTWACLFRNGERELINHKTLLHPNIIRFKEVFVTSTHLGIVMEYAAGGELFDR